MEFAVAPPQSGSSTTDYRWNLEMLVFVEGGKLEEPEKNPRSKDENQQPIEPTYGTRDRESNPDHIGGRRALSPLRHPCSHLFYECYLKDNINVILTYAILIMRIHV